MRPSSPFAVMVVLSFLVVVVLPARTLGESADLLATDRAAVGGPPAGDGAHAFVTMPVDGSFGLIALPSDGTATSSTRRDALLAEIRRRVQDGGAASRAKPLVPPSAAATVASSAAAAAAHPSAVFAGAADEAHEEVVPARSPTAGTVEPEGLPSFDDLNLR